MSLFKLETPRYILTTCIMGDEQHFYLELKETNEAMGVWVKELDDLLDQHFKENF